MAACLLFFIAIACISMIYGITNTDRMVFYGQKVFDDLAAASGTDKLGHGYRRMYGTLLLPMAEKFALEKKKMKFLEIGLGCDMTYGPGHSAKLWQMLFSGKDVELWEADVDATCVAEAEKKGQLQGFNTLTGDQGDAATLQSWITKSGGKFDVIVDDGGHRAHMIYNSLVALWPELNPGGWYFIEDIHISYETAYHTAGYAPTALMIQSWVEALALEPAPVSHHHQQMAKNFPIPAGCDMILCQREACALHKEGPLESIA